MALKAGSAEVVVVLEAGSAEVVVVLEPGSAEVVMRLEQEVHGCGCERFLRVLRSALHLDNFA